MKKYIHYIIGLAIMFAFRLIPVGVLPGVTEIGLSILGIFIGTLYLWTTVDPLTSSLLSILMLATCGYAPLKQLIPACFGTPLVIQILFLMVFLAGLTNRKLTDYIGRWVITRKFIEGKPWVFTTVILFATYIMSVFVGVWTPILLFWPILYTVFEDVGFKKDDKYVKILILSIVIVALIGFPVPPYMSNGLALLSNYRGLIANFPELAAMGDAIAVADPAYFFGCLAIGAVEVVLIILVIKFILKPDVAPLKEVTIDMLNKNPLPPMNKAQKCYGVFLVIFIAAMLLPSLFPTLPVLSFLNQNANIVPVILVTLLCIIRFEDGPVLKIGPTMGAMGWPSYFLIVAAIYLGNVLTNEATGITVFLNTILGPVFNGMSATVFTVAILVICVVLTNISNSLVIGMILQPVILTFCAQTGINPAPIVSIMIFTVLSTAACTPAASPFAAMLFGNKEYLKSSDIYKYSGIFVIVEVIFILLVGIPFMNMMIG